MMVVIPTTEPAELRIGDTWQWRREDLSDYPPGTWSLSYHFRNASAYFDVAASADGAAFAVSVAKTTTATRVAGWYDWVAEVTDGTQRFDVGHGRAELLANYALAAALDGRSFARKMVDYIEAALLSRASTDQLDLVNAALADRSLSRDKSGLISLRAQFKSEIVREEARLAGRRASRILAVG